MQRLTFQNATLGSANYAIICNQNDTSPAMAEEVCQFGEASVLASRTIN